MGGDRQGIEGMDENGDWGELMLGFGDGVGEDGVDGLEEGGGGVGRR